MKIASILLILPLVVNGFAPALTSSFAKTSSATSDTILYADVASEVDVEVAVDPKEAVKLFGRLAEKYIMLDSSGGMCCYSACTDCEYRLPDGGYIMADQSAARPKWIPSYEERKFDSGKEHTSAWSQVLFISGPNVNREEFVERVKEMKFAPPLGGPYMSASKAGIEDDFAVERLFDVLMGDKLGEGKQVLTKHRMSKRIKEIAGGEEGLAWKHFEASLSN
mmetsp:Transcript_23659/g.35155  ORF Transcript_23659/g.35155 Transcript_23659/m.35155 type:complete len:222 (+) Transcript_23659:119-784(+)